MPFPIPLFALAVGAEDVAAQVAKGVLAAVGVFVFFGLSVLVHEGGHFFAAKRLGLRADVFSIGFGPALWKKTIRGTEYRLSAIPFGGYVSLPQLDPAGMQRIQGGAEPGSDGAPEPAIWWKRLLVAVAGPLCNLLFAVPLAFAVWALPPVIDARVEFEGAVVGVVEQGSVAETAGLRAGDRILRVEDKTIASWGDFVQEVHFCGASGVVSLAVSNRFDGVEATLQVPVGRNRLLTRGVEGVSPASPLGVGRVAPGSAAAAAGLRAGDTLLAVDGVRGVSSASFGQLLAAAAAEGRPARVSVLRGRTVWDSELAVPTGPLPDEKADPDLRPGVRVLEVLPELPAARAGLRPGDFIESLDGEPVRRTSSFIVAVRGTAEEPASVEPHQLRVLRFPAPGADGAFAPPEEIELTVVPAPGAGEGAAARPQIGAVLSDGPSGDSLTLLRTGVRPAPVRANVPPWSRYRTPGAQLRGDAATVWRVFGPLFGRRHKGELGAIATSLGGPVIILSSIWSWLMTSFAAGVGLIRFLNVNLAIVNLLPIPVLDGGHVVFALWRGVTGRELPPRVIEILVNVFAILLLIAVALLTGCDAIRLWSRFA